MDESEPSAESTGSTDSAMIEEMTQALAENRKIEAIRIYREAKGVSLLEAKEFLDQLIPQLIEKDPERFAALANSSSGCGGAAVLMMLVMCGVAFLIWTQAV